MKFYLSSTLLSIIIVCVLSNDNYKCDIADDAYCGDRCNEDMAEFVITLDKSDGTGQTVGLSGEMTTKMKVDDEYLITCEIMKASDQGSELVFSIRSSFCDLLAGDPNAPWNQVMSQLGIDSCPISATTLKCSNLTIDTSSMQDFMNDQYVGAYEACCSLGKPQSDAFVLCISLNISEK